MIFRYFFRFGLTFESIKEPGVALILMVVNRFSTLAKMALIKTIITNFDSAKLFFDMWVKHDRMLQFIVSDEDAKFTMGF